MSAAVVSVFLIPVGTSLFDVRIFAAAIVYRHDFQWEIGEFCPEIYRKTPPL